ncbi:hypothetical protein BKA80DRAFT_130062 [Phyllosticta citrichinensis]
MNVFFTQPLCCRLLSPPIFSLGKQSATDQVNLQQVGIYAWAVVQHRACWKRQGQPEIRASTSPNLPLTPNQSTPDERQTARDFPRICTGNPRLPMALVYVKLQLWPVTTATKWYTFLTALRSESLFPHPTTKTSAGRLCWTELLVQWGTLVGTIKASGALEFSSSPLLLNPVE